MSSCPSNPGLLLWLARSSHSVHAPGHSSVGKGSRAAWVLTRGYPAWSFLLPRKITWGICVHFDHSPLEILCRKDCLCMHRSALWHTGGTLGDTGPGTDAPWRGCASSLHIQTAQLGDADSWGILGRNNLQCAAPAGTPCSQDRPGHQFECQAQHPFPLLSPAGDTEADSHVGCSALSHQISLHFRSMDKKIHDQSQGQPQTWDFPSAILSPSARLFQLYVGTLPAPSGDTEGMEQAEG